MSQKNLILKILLPLLIILAGSALTLLLVMARSAPEREEKAYSGPLVDVMDVSVTTQQVDIPGTGTVRPTQEVDITPQVSGMVSELSPQMVEGGFFRKGDRLFAIEAVDYQLALERARSALAQAELELARNESLAEIARLEWDRIGREDDSSANPLTLYEPQLKAAKAQVASARSAVRQAELDLSRTIVTAPFNCYVRNEQIDLGQYVRAGVKVATVAGTDAVEIVVPLQLEEIAWLQVPRDANDGPGSPASVTITVGEQHYEWPGAIVRSLREVDPRSRMAKIVVAVEDPFGTFREQPDGQRPHLSPGMFVDVLLHGTVLDDVIAIPRGALRDNDTVWVVNGDDRLEIRPVDIIRRERRIVLVGSGISAGERLVLSGLAAAADGMLLRPQAREAAQ